MSIRTGNAASMRPHRLLMVFIYTAFAALFQSGCTILRSCCGYPPAIFAHPLPIFAMSNRRSSKLVGRNSLQKTSSSSANFTPPAFDGEGRWLIAAWMSLVVHGLWTSMASPSGPATSTIGRHKTLWARSCPGPYCPPPLVWGGERRCGSGMLYGGGGGGAGAPACGTSACGAAWGCWGCGLLGGAESRSESCILKHWDTCEGLSVFTNVCFLSLRWASSNHIPYPFHSAWNPCFPFLAWLTFSFSSSFSLSCFSCLILKLPLWKPTFFHPHLYLA